MSDVRLEWASAPISLHFINPFIVSLLSDSLEIHDVASLSTLQRIALPSSAPISAFTSVVAITYSFSSCEIDASKGQEFGYVSAGDQVHVLRMTPLSTQIMSLLDAQRFEDAINLCILCQHNPQLKDIDVPGVHEKYAFSLYQKGDFEGCIAHFLKADSNPKKVLALFPDLVPTNFNGFLGISQASASVVAPSRATSTRPVSAPAVASSVPATGKMTGLVLQRAAAALVSFCEHHRTQMKSSVELAERYKSSSASAASSLENLDNSIIQNWEEILNVAEVVDTVLLAALLNCHPPRKSSVIELLSSQPSSSNPFAPPVNHCHMESSSVLLAAQGNAFTEALLWLYRSHGEHKRVLVALTEDRCVGVGAWNREQFYTWTADYLRWLWYHDDSSLPITALNSLRPVLEYDAELGLSVLTSRPKGSLSATGGKGTDIHDILTFLESVKPRAVGKGTTLAQLASQKKSSLSLNQSSASVTDSALSDAPFARIPLVNGRALALTYLGSSSPRLYMLLMGLMLIVDRMARDQRNDSGKHSRRVLPAAHRGHP